MAGQESFTLYLKADSEGYLDKINSSKWLPGKSRVWCELYRTVLHVFKESKRSSSGAQQIDMKQVHTVRRSTTDKSGTQLEIIGKNKQHTFGASSAEECSNWIQQLQTAMMLDGKEGGSAPTSTVMVGDYETIAVLSDDKPESSHIKIRASGGTDCGYSEVEIQPTPANSKTTKFDKPSTCRIIPAEDDDGYTTVELRKSQGSNQPMPQKSSGPSSQSAPDKPVVVEDSDGYAVVQMRKKSLSEVPPRSSGSAPKTENKDEEPYIYSKVKPKAERGGTSAAGKVQRSGSTSAEGGTPSGSSDEDDLLIAAAQRKPDPVPLFPHPLQPDDLQPLAALQEFLSCNQKLCRPSFSERTVTDNPVDDMKRLLKELHL
ncbi:hypothetical protein ACOMHN_020889 [Nucella lapillus]